MHSKGPGRVAPGKLLPLLLSLASFALIAAPSPGATVIYSTGFEASEGYSTNLDLAGQNGWVSYGSGGNGIVTGYFPSQGQHAYVGSTPPATNDNSLTIWQPINLDPVPTNTPIVKFSVLMDIEDSTNAQWDYFDWSVYNKQGNQLFTVDFDNYALEVYYALDGTNGFVDTGVSFSNHTPYTLTVTMDFLRGRWTATLGDTLLATNRPMTTTNAPLNLGDVDAVWVPFDPAAPGDNHMVFDNYRITAEAIPPPPPKLSVPQRFGNGTTLLRLSGRANSRFAIDATTNLVNWTALKTNVATDGYFDYLDTNAPAFPRRFYRGRWVP